MRALIVGGGIAGPATALALARSGIEPVIIERRARVDPDVGSYFTVAPNGLDALDAVAGPALVEDIGFASRTNVLIGATGRRLGEVSLGHALPDGRVGLTMKRSMLAARLAQQAEAVGITMHRGSAVTDIEIGGPGQHQQVGAVLSDGTRLTGDLLIGADGVHSLVRRRIDPTSPSARYVGLTNFGGVTRQTPLAADLTPEAWHMVFGRRAFFGAHPTPDGDVVWFVNVPEPEISRDRRAATPPDQWQHRLAGLLADDVGPGAELVLSGTLELAGDNTYDLPRVPTWHRGRAVLLGDAAHAPSPSSGQGASLALEDAAELAYVLGSYVPGSGANPATGVVGALAAFERVRRARVERVVAAGARSSRSKIPGPIGRRVSEAMMRLVFRHLITEERLAWMSDYRVPRLRDRELPPPRRAG